MFTIKRAKQKNGKFSTKTLLMQDYNTHVESVMKSTNNNTV